VAWARDLEEQVTCDGEATWMSEMDDFDSEREEVAHDQGLGIPYSRGFWLACNLASAINPNDLDMLDEELPLTMFTLSNLLGRVLSPEEYDHYWHHYMENPAKTDAERAKVQGLWGMLKEKFGVASLGGPLYPPSPYEATSIAEVKSYQVTILAAR